MQEVSDAQLIKVVRRLCLNHPFSEHILLLEIERVVRRELAYYVETPNGILQVLNASGEDEAVKAAKAKGYTVLSEPVFEADFPHTRDSAFFDSIKSR